MSVALELQDVDFGDEQEEIGLIPEDWDERGHETSSAWGRYAIYVSQERFDANPMHRKFIHPDTERHYVKINDFWFLAIIDNAKILEKIKMTPEEYADLPREDRYVVKGQCYAIMDGSPVIILFE